MLAGAGSFELCRRDSEAWSTKLYVLIETPDDLDLGGLGIYHKVHGLRQNMELGREAFYYWHGLNGAPPTCPEFNSPERRDPRRFAKRNPCSRKYKRGGFYGVDQVRGASLWLWRAQIWVKDDPSVPRGDHSKDKKGRYLKIGGKKSLLVAAVARDLEARYRGLQSVVKFNFDNTMLCIMMCCMDPWDPMPIPGKVLQLLRSKLPREQFYTIHPRCACISALPPRELTSRDAAYRNPLLAFPKIREMLSPDELGRVTVLEKDPPPRKPALPAALAAALDPSRAHAPPLMPAPAATAATAATAAAAAVRLPGSAAVSIKYRTTAAAQTTAAATAVSRARAGAAAVGTLNGGRGTRHSLRPRDHVKVSGHLRPLLAAATQQSSSSSAASSSRGMSHISGGSMEQRQLSIAIPMGELRASDAAELGAAQGAHMAAFRRRGQESMQWEAASSQAQSRGTRLEQSFFINVSVPTGMHSVTKSQQPLVTSEADAHEPHESRGSRQGLSSSVSSLQIGSSFDRLEQQGSQRLGNRGTSGRAAFRGGGTNRRNGTLRALRSEETMSFRAVDPGSARSPAMSLRRRLSTGSSVGTASTAGRAANKVLKSDHRIGIVSDVDDSYLPSPIVRWTSERIAQGGAPGNGSAPGAKRPRPAQHRHAQPKGTVGNGTGAPRASRREIPSNGASGGPSKRRRVEQTSASGGRIPAQLPQPSPEDHREAADALVGLSSQARSETPGSVDGSLSDARSEASSLMDGVGGNLAVPSYGDPPSLPHPLFSAHSASSMQPTISPSNGSMYQRSSAEYLSSASSRAMAHGLTGMDGGGQVAAMHPQQTQLEAFVPSLRSAGDLDNGQFDLLSGLPEESGDQAPEVLGQAADASHVDRNRTPASQNDPRDFGLYRITNYLDTRPPPISTGSRGNSHNGLGMSVPSGLRRDISSGSQGRSTSGLPVVGDEGMSGAVPEAAGGMVELSGVVMNGETTPRSAAQVGPPAAVRTSSNGADYIGGLGTGADGAVASSQLGSDSGRSSSVSISRQLTRFVGLPLPENSSEGVAGGSSHDGSETSAGLPRGGAVSPNSIRSEGGSRAE